MLALSYKFFFYRLTNALGRSSKNQVVVLVAAVPLLDSTSSTPDDVSTDPCSGHGHVVVVVGFSETLLGVSSSSSRGSGSGFGSSQAACGRWRLLLWNFYTSRLRLLLFDHATTGGRRDQQAGPVP